MRRITCARAPARGAGSVDLVRTCLWPAFLLRLEVLAGVVCFPEVRAGLRPLPPSGALEHLFPALSLPWPSHHLHLVP